MIVVDASVIADVLVNYGTNGDLARFRVAGEELHAPSLIAYELMSVMRKTELLGNISHEGAIRALGDYLSLDISLTTPSGTEQLFPRMWELRNNLTSYDAAYVALAESLDAVLVTTDSRLASAPGILCQVETLSAAGA